jgi:excisionase family DNA binding protein
MATDTFRQTDREPGVMTTEEVAARLRVSERSVQRQIAAGRLRACRIGRSIRITEKQLEEFLEGRAAS